MPPPQWLITGSNAFRPSSKPKRLFVDWEGHIHLPWPPDGLLGSYKKPCKKITKNGHFLHSRGQGMVHSSARWRPMALAPSNTPKYASTYTSHCLSHCKDVDCELLKAGTNLFLLRCGMQTVTYSSAICSNSTLITKVCDLFIKHLAGNTLAYNKLTSSDLWLRFLTSSNLILIKTADKVSGNHYEARTKSWVCLIHIFNYHLILLNLNSVYLMMIGIWKCEQFTVF